MRTFLLSLNMTVKTQSPGNSQVRTSKQKGNSWTWPKIKSHIVHIANNSPHLVQWILDHWYVFGNPILNSKNPQLTPSHPPNQHEKKTKRKYHRNSDIALIVPEERLRLVVKLHLLSRRKGTWLLSLCEDGFLCGRFCAYFGVYIGISWVEPKCGHR